MREDDRDRIARQGTEAWKRLKQEKSWHDWLKVGEALQVGRTWAMAQAQTNKPESGAYNIAFGEWMQRYKLDDMDKGARSRLFKVMEALPLIEQWRQTLTATERMKLNHPHSVLRKFENEFVNAAKPKKPAKPGLRDSVTELSEENARLVSENEKLKAYIAELEAARDQVPRKSIGDRTAAERKRRQRERERALKTVTADLVGSSTRSE